MAQAQDQSYDPAADALDNLAQLSDDPELEEDELPVAERDDEDGVEVVPEMHDPKWTEYVMKQLRPDELFDGYPVVDGLRRVAVQLLGPIVSSKPKTISAPSSANDFGATVEWELVIDWERDIEERGRHQRVFGDVANVSSLNTEPPFHLHPAASAATKAEGRALRKALMLSRIHTAEEMMDTPEDTGNNGKTITNSQFTFFHMKGHDLDINVAAMLELAAKNNKCSVKEIPYHKAAKMFEWISHVQCGTKQIPENLRGFDPDWRKKVGV